ncbi:peptidase S8/S53 subtilisin kexin sedolisin [Deinococcus phoenicis]|uniref:Peptidase S8/S53 subtilisin kexin sedolisin n=1 Tax=Deinococcus phoenicis TaxID=1476583 RepID=A0A016QQN1_9DEIO|nr:S8 family peptidase [Deinococcus phoenicis]EYB68398.1 peptidase S8/S53 subtilisin kexin sedolisin [Deinococcus phoenicis]
MNSRLALGTLGLTLLLAACGQQPATQASTPAGGPQASTPDRSSRTAPLLGTSSADTIPGQYIVAFSDRADSATLGAQDAGGLIRSLGLDPQGITVQHIYSQAMKGFAARLSAQNLATLRADRRVKYIEQDQMMQADATQTNPTWGLDRIDQRNLPLDKSYTYGSASNVKAYILDTGINTAHTAFGGRAVWGTNTTGDGNNSDCQGHGTHVAGTVGSSTWGVAKDVKLVAVKVLGCDGTGSNSGIIAGMDWVVSNKTGPSVVNMSLGPQSRSTSQALDDAVARLYNNNVNVVVAAGNSNDDANYYSPARAPQAITVGATTSTDARSSFSNYGTALDIFAPGSDITSTWIGSTTATNTISGTSMATPHVVGAVALILGANPSYTPAQVTSALVNNATTGKVTGVNGSVNRLLYTGTGGTAPTPTPAPGTTYTGSVSQGSSSWKPGTGGFSYAGGTLRGTLSGPSGSDFDLYLQKWSGSAWQDVAASEGGTSSESINYAAGSGTYRWEVYAYSGSGSYSLAETK